MIVRLRQVGDFVLEPLSVTFSDWHAMAVVRERLLKFGLRLRSQMLSGDAGIATCGPCIHKDSGVWTMEVSVLPQICLDGFCRADVGLVLDKKDLSQRCGSGIWWEAGDGDVFIAEDAGAERA